MRIYLLFKSNSSVERSLIAFLLFILISVSGNAQSLLNDNFEYITGNLNGQGEWLQWRTSQTNPIQIVDTALTYPVYQDKAIGKAVKTGENGQVAHKLFAEVATGSIYYSALVYVHKTMNKTGDYFLCLGDGQGGPTLYGRLFARTNANDKLQFGISRSGTPNSTKPEETYGTAEYEFNKVYLVIVKYTFKEGDKNDEVSLFVNPVINDMEPVPTFTRTNETTMDPQTGFAGINIRQPTLKGGAAIATIDAIRVSTTWKDLFAGPGENTPSLTVTPKTVIFGNVFEGDTYHKVINIKGKDLKGDITVGGLNSGEVAVSAETISQEQATSESGFDLTVTLNPVSEELYTDEITFSTEGAKEAKVSVMWSTTTFVNVPDLKALRDKDREDTWTKYRITGEAVISHIYKDGEKTYYYLQDEERGITVYDAFGSITTPYETGDKVTRFCGSISSTLGSLSFIPVKDFGAPVSSGNEILPAEVTLTDLKARSGEYESRLVKTEIEFKGIASTENPPLFTEGSNPDITDGTTDAKMRIFKGADYIGMPIPAKATLTGISTAGNGSLVAPRNQADITEPAVSDGNLFTNPGFEEWTGNDLFGYNPEDWESVMGTTFKETSVKLSGSCALRIKTDKKDAKLEQEVRPVAPEALIPGQRYELKLNYNTLSSLEGNDISLKSYWRAGGTTELTHDKEILNNGTFFTSVGKWGSKTIETSVPEGATSFYFALVIPKGGAEVVFDDFSFKKIPSTEPMLTMMPDKIAKLNTDIHVPVRSQKIMIYTDNLPADVSLEITGQHASYFTPSVTTIPTSQHITELTIQYNPETAGEHSAMLTVECSGMAALTQTLSVKGYAVDPANPPSITVNETGPIALEAAVGKNDEHTLSVSSKNLTDYLYARIMGEDGKGQFILSNTLLEKNKENIPLKITFTPKQEGRFNERIAIYSKTDTVFVTLTGKGTQGSAEEPEGDKFPLDVSNPRTLLNEHFDAVTHNKVLKIDGWKNIAQQNNRAWWGYQFKNEQDKVTESTAKVTAYSSSVTESLPHEMWLVTPPLDFKNAASKIFTFRVMGDLLVEGQDALLEICYMDMEDGELYTSPIDLAIPAIPDENKEWREYHLNLEGQNLADVFFIGFHFKGTGGKVNSAVYYIDDVSFGRTDLPSVTPSKTTLEMETYTGVTVTSDLIQIQGNNLTSPIELKIGGPNASKFKSSVATLPSTGGSFAVSFQSELTGVHQAYVKISSRGAADVYIPVSANNRDGSGIENIYLNRETEVTVFDYTGRELLRKTIYGSVEPLFKELENGIYLLKTELGVSKLRVSK